MAQYEENAVIIGKEIEKLNFFEKFNRFIYLCSFHHVDRCGQEKCINFDFVNKLEHIHAKNYSDEVDGKESLQKFCWEYHDSFYLLS